MRLVISVATSLLVPVLGLAAQQSGNSGWYVRLAPSLWMSSIHGQNTLGDLDLSIVPTALRPGWWIHAESGWQRYRMFVDVGRAGVDEPISGQPVPGQDPFRFTTLTLEIVGAVQLNSMMSSPGIEFVAGARYLRHAMSVIDPDTVVSSTHGWLKPTLGTRYFTELGQRFWFTMRGDVGGDFFWGNDVTWLLDGQFGVRVGSMLDVTMRYRYSETEYSTPGYSWRQGQVQGWFFGVSYKYDQHEAGR